MKQSLLYCLLILQVPAFSQIQTAVLKPDAIIKLTLRKEKAPFPLQVKVGSLSILDSRADTTNLGYSVYRKGKKYDFKAGFKNEMSAWLSRYLNIPSEHVNGSSLLVNIKKLRVSEEATLKILDNGKTALVNNGWEKGVIVKIEYYLQKDSFFIPLYRYDSIIPLNGFLPRNADEFITIGLRASLVKLFTIKDEFVSSSKKRVLITDIQRLSKEEYHFPVYENTTKKKGVYKTFNDFKMNHISWTDFEFKKGEKADIIFVKENADEVAMNNVWGFCDGENYYINSGNKYSKLIPTGKTFYFEGLKSLSVFLLGGSANNLRGVPVPDIGMAGSSSSYNSVNQPYRTEFAVELKYYQLDMENGKIY